MSWVNRLLQPKVLLPVLLSAAALATAFSISNIGEVWNYVSRLSIPVMGIVFGLALFYLVVKWLLFHYLLRKSRVRATMRQSGVAYIVGEMAVPVPAGVYLENYVLGSIGSSATRSAGTTTAMLIAELLVCLAALVIVGVPGWWWLRPAVGILLSISTLLVAAFVLIEPLRDFGERVLDTGPIRVMHKGILEALEGIEDLANLEAVAFGVPAVVLYMLALVAAYQFVGHAVGVERLTFAQALSIYFFSLAVTEMLPISVNLGIVELSGIGAAQAWGYSYSEGLAMMLGTRLVWTGAIWLIGAFTLLLLRDEFSRWNRGEQRQREDRDVEARRSGEHRAA